MTAPELARRQDVSDRTGRSFMFVWKALQRLYAKPYTCKEIFQR
jgi:hypothetical protein